jgi:hypothetical protein
VWGFGRAIALRRFNAVQQFRADSVIDLCIKALIAALALIACTMQIALPNRTTFQLPAKRGLVQIANALIELRTSSTLPRCSRVTGYPEVIQG